MDCIEYRGITTQSKMGGSLLWRRIDQANVRDVAIVGTSKHAGKTTVLGSLLRDAEAAGRSVAVASIGHDGERADALLGIPKPAIQIAKGTLFATAINVHRHDHALVRWLEPAGISSPFGEVWVGQAESAGTVELAGVRQLAHLRLLRERFHQLGAGHVLFDGALARMAAISPQVADGVILAVGAAVGGLDRVLRETELAVLRLTAPLAEGSAAAFAKAVASEPGLVAASLAISDSGGDANLQQAEVKNWRTVADVLEWFGAGGALPPLAPTERLLYYGGAVTDVQISAMLGSPRPLMLVARDPSRLFVSKSRWRALLRAGHDLRVMESVPLLGVAINPYTPFGEILDRQLMVAQLQAKVNVPVWDVMEQVMGDGVDG